MPSTLWAVSDLHAALPANGPQIERIAPTDSSDWLIVAGDVAENLEKISRVMENLTQRFEKVIWTPGNHELFSRSTDRYRGRDRYDVLVHAMREIGVTTPEDPYPTFGGVTVAPLFTLYDYSFRPAHLTVEQAIEAAYENNLVLTDEFAIAPFVDLRAWCWQRLAYTARRLSRINGPTILINHWPLVQEPVLKLRWSEVGLWCGTRHTRSWARRYRAKVVIYGHLHMPGATRVDGIDHVDVSLGYPREWQRFESALTWPYPVMKVDN